MTERQRLEEQILSLLERLDVISLAEHQEDVSHISLVGLPVDVEVLNSYLTKYKRKML